MQFRYFLLCIAILTLLTGCVKDQSEQESRIEQLIDEKSELKDEIADLETKITNLKNTLNDITEERNKYLQQLDEFYLTKITGDIDLVYWDRDHIVRALGHYNEKFKSAVWQTYHYRRDQKDFYWAFNNSLGFVPDPFFELRRRDRETELDFFHFRIERLALNYNQTLAQEKYESYLQDVWREAQIDPDLTCYQQTTCRDIKVVKCSKDNKDYNSWFEGSYLFITRFDGRVALDAFEDFYCRPDPYASLQ